MRPSVESDQVCLHFSKGFFKNIFVWWWWLLWLFCNNSISKPTLLPIVKNTMKPIANFCVHHVSINVDFSCKIGQCILQQNLIKCIFISLKIISKRYLFDSDDYCDCFATVISKPTLLLIVKNTMKPIANFCVNHVSVNVDFSCKIGQCTLQQNLIKCVFISLKVFQKHICLMAMITVTVLQQ
jgi:hypothetical protein